MTERQQLEAMLTRAGIAFRASEPDDPYVEPNQLRVCADDNVTRSDIGEGYHGFFTVFSFDEAGALLQVGSWE